MISSGQDRSSDYGKIAEEGLIRMVADRNGRPGNLIVQCLAAAEGGFVNRDIIENFLIAKNRSDTIRNKKIEAYLGDVRKYDYDLVERRGDKFRLVNHKDFDQDGHNYDDTVPPGLIVKKNIG